MGTMASQYNWLLESREIVLDHCIQMESEKFSERKAEFKMNSVNMLLVHTANTYLHWIGEFGLGKKINYYKDSMNYSVDDIRTMFKTADLFVSEFIQKYDNAPDTMITGYNSLAEGNVSYPALRVFMHALTHEFHHKGQLMSISSLIGYPPPDADIIHFNDH